MNFLDFVKDLLPSFDRNSIVESAALCADDLNKQTLPVLKTAADTIGNRKFSSKLVTGKLSEIKKVLPGKNTFEELHGVLSNAVTIMGFVEDHNKKIFSETETNKGLTYTKATLLRVIQASTFASVYARRFLLFVYQEEAFALLGEVDGKLSPKEMAWLESEFENFLVAVRVLKTPCKDLEGYIKTLPEAIVNELTHSTFTQTLGDHKIDPMALNHLSVKYNPFYFIGMMVAQYQAENFKSAQEEVKMLQLRNLQLQKLDEKMNDAGLQKEIAYNQDRITGLRAKLEKMEKDYAL